MKHILLILFVFGSLMSCKDDSKTPIVEEEPIENPYKVESETKAPAKIESVADLKAKLTENGYKIFDYIDEKTQDTVLMQQYYIAFLKKGPIRNQNEEEANRLQSEHMAHLGKMYDLGYADISGPFDDDSDISGITIYNVPTLEMADSLANSDPMVKAGRLVIEVHPWWAAKGFGLR